jgi:hypothetical protein
VGLLTKDDISPECHFGIPLVSLVLQEFLNKKYTIYLIICSIYGDFGVETCYKFDILQQDLYYIIPIISHFKNVPRIFVKMNICNWTSTFLIHVIGAHLFPEAVIY